jgi:hypothetical protein
VLFIPEGDVHLLRLEPIQDIALGEADARDFPEQVADEILE